MYIIFRNVGIFKKNEIRNVLFEEKKEEFDRLGNLGLYHLLKWNTVL
jgi:hypothetical protein